jgi:hypothetical protein
MLQYTALHLSKQKSCRRFVGIFLVILLHFITLRDYKVSYKKIFFCMHVYSTDRPEKKYEMLSPYLSTSYTEKTRSILGV